MRSFAEGSCHDGRGPIVQPVGLQLLINAVTVQVKSAQIPLSGYPTTQELAEERSIQAGKPNAGANVTGRT